MKDENFCSLSFSGFNSSFIGEFSCCFQQKTAMYDIKFQQNASRQCTFRYQSYVENSTINLIELFMKSPSNYSNSTTNTFDCEDVDEGSIIETRIVFEDDPNVETMCPSRKRKITLKYIPLALNNLQQLVADDSQKIEDFSQIVEIEECM